jgi:hypothetical protein
MIFIFLKDILCVRGPNPEYQPVSPKIICSLKIEKCYIVSHFFLVPFVSNIFPVINAVQWLVCTKMLLYNALFSTAGRIETLRK